MNVVGVEYCDPSAYGWAEAPPDAAGEPVKIGGPWTDGVPEGVDCYPAAAVGAD